MAKGNYIGPQQIPGVPRSRLSKVERGQKEEVHAPSKPLSVTQFLSLHRTSLSLPVGGQRLCEAVFGECNTGNHECYGWLEPLATGDKWGKEGEKNMGPLPHCTIMGLSTV